MALTAKGMTIYESFYDAIKALPDDSTRWQAVKMMLEYCFDGVIPDTEGLHPMLSMFWLLVQPNLDKNMKLRRAAAAKKEKDEKAAQQDDDGNNTITDEIMDKYNITPPEFTE